MKEDAIEKFVDTQKKMTLDLFNHNKCLIPIIAILAEKKDKYGVHLLPIPPDLFEDDKKDFVHTDDPYLFTLMIYLSETNLKSGTGLFDTITSKKPNTIVDFVQNRAFLFNSKIPHKSLHNYGSNINNGRLTLNCFIKYINEK